MSSLHVVQPRAPIARSRTSKWRAFVLLGIHLLMAAHIAHWLLNGSSISPLEPSEAVAYSRSGVLNAGLVFFAATILLTAVFGRFFCGWGCHLVALQDLSRSLLQRFGRRPSPLRSRFLAWAPMAVFLYLFLWPLMVRLLRGDSWRPARVELVSTEFWARFPGWPLALLTFAVCGFAAIWFLGAKGFCTYACPYGAAFSVADRVAPLRIRVTDDCEGCGHCTAVCTSNVRVHEEVRDFGMITDPGCMKCMDCVSVCPKDALYYGAGPIPLLARDRDGESSGARARPGPTPRRDRAYSLELWEETVAAAGFALAYLTFRGLYGAVPILLALGMAALFAFFLLSTVRLALKPHLAFKGWRLKRKGRILTAGWIAAGLLALLLTFWGHSAWMRWSLQRGEAGFAQLAPARAAALDLASAPAEPATVRRAEEVARHYRTMIEGGLFPTFAAHQRLASLALVSGDDQQALAAARRSLEREERVLDSHLVAATAAARSGRFDQALHHYDEVLDLAPDHRGALVHGGLVLAELSRFGAAAERFTEGAIHHPEAAVFPYNRGLAAAMGGDLETAVSGFRRALEIDPDHLPALENLAGALAQSGRLVEARRRYQEALTRAPGDAATRTLLARVLLELGELEAARSQLERALEIDPSATSARGLLRELGTGGA